MKYPLLALFAAVALSAQPTVAQTLQTVKIEPATVKPGESVNITATFDISNAMNCNVRFNFGDGQSSNAKINQTQDAVMVVPHTYAKAGNYTVVIEPKTALPMLKCSGRNQTAVVKVVAPPPVAASAPAPTAVATGPACPAGWKLAPKSVNKKTGAYQCTAKPGTAAPADKLKCPGDLGYFESSKKGQLGCQP